MSFKGLDENSDGQDAGATGEGDGDAGAGLNAMLSKPDTDFVTEEKKPANRGLFAMAGLVLVCGAGMYFMWARGGPAKAVAETKESKAANTTIKSFLAEDKDNVKKMKELLQSTETVVQQFLTSAGKAQVPLKDLRTNPFRLSSTKTKAEVDDATSRKQREDERVAVLKAVQALELQSVIHSDARKACMVNGSLYVEGQQVDGFTVEQITPKAVIVRKDVYRFELRMQK